VAGASKPWLNPPPRPAAFWLGRPRTVGIGSRWQVRWKSCCLLTTRANRFGCPPIHGRMPVILPAGLGRGLAGGLPMAPDCGPWSPFAWGCWDPQGWESAAVGRQFPCSLICSLTVSETGRMAPLSNGGPVLLKHLAFRPGSNAPQPARATASPASLLRNLLLLLLAGDGPV